MKFLSYNGLDYFWEKIKLTFAEKPVIYTATLATTGWVGTSAPYSQTVTVPGVTVADTGVFDIATAGKDYATTQQLQSEGGKIVDVVINDGSVTVRASAIPAVDIPVFWQIVR